MTTATLPVSMVPDANVVRLNQKIYLHGFPKAGLHLAEQFIKELAQPIKDFPWFGNSVGNAWTMERCHLEAYPMIFGNFPIGGFVKGHCAWTMPIARTLWENDICVIFVYRNLRDVAVSAAHHVLDTRQAADGDHLKHPNKQLYQNMDSFEDVLLAIINGIDKYPGVIARWEEYTSWLDEKWVLSVRFEDMRYRTKEAAEQIARYVVGQSASYAGLSVSLSQSGLDSLTGPMIASVNRRQTVTMRKGKSGGWRKHWTEAVAKAFKDAGGDYYNERMGYQCH